MYEGNACSSGESKQIQSVRSCKTQDSSSEVLLRKRQKDIARDREDETSCDQARIESPGTKKWEQDDDENEEGRERLQDHEAQSAARLVACDDGRRARTANDITALGRSKVRLLPLPALLRRTAKSHGLCADRPGPRSALSPDRPEITAIKPNSPCPVRPACAEPRLRSDLEDHAHYAES